MALVLRNIYRFYNEHLIENSDARLDGLFLVGSPLPVICIIAMYLYFVNGYGQNWMKTKQPYELNAIINVYNIAQICINFYIGMGSFRAAIELENFNITCIPVSKNDYSVPVLKILYYSHLYYLLKILDLLDTVFFILRKRNDQVSFLHIYHHAAMVFGCYIHMKALSGGGHAIILGVINSFVHVIMYGYYFLTSFKPELKKSLWWKKYITQVQMVQFLILIVYFSIPLFKECNFPKLINFGIALQNVFMLALFGDFYYKTYIRRSQIKTK